MYKFSLTRAFLFLRIMVINLVQKKIHFDLRFILTYNINIRMGKGGPNREKKRVKIHVLILQMPAYLKTLSQEGGCSYSTL